MTKAVFEKKELLSTPGAHVPGTRENEAASRGTQGKSELTP